MSFVGKHIITDSQHVEIASLDPGASGATWIDVSADTLGGWRLDADTEILEFRADACDDWNSISDIEIKIAFEVNVDNSGGGDADTVDLKIVASYKGSHNGDLTCKTQTVEIVNVVGKSAQYKSFVTTISLAYDAVGNLIDKGDKITCKLNLETDTSEVDNIIVNHVHVKYNLK